MPPTDQPHLTDFLPAATLRGIMDSFAAVTGYPAAVEDAHGRLLAESGEEAAARRDRELRRRASGDGRPARFTIESEGRRIGALRLCERGDGSGLAAGAERAERSAESPSQRGGATTAETVPAERAEAERFLDLLSQTISQLCHQGLELQHRVQELRTLFDLSTLLAGQRDLQSVLDTVTKQVVELMGVKAAAIRLVDEEARELRTAAVHNLSARYLNKGRIRLDDSEMDRAALRGEVIYVADMANDPRVLYPEDARKEGLASILGIGLVYRGKPIGVMRVFSGEPRQFDDNDRDLLRAIAQLAAAAIRNVQLDTEAQERRRIERQVQLAADVQRKLLPQGAPACAPFEAAGRYEPCFELGGDFYDFIPLADSLGVVVGDVVGKGVAASLLMASVRAALRAYVESIYDLDQVLAHVNRAMVRDMRDHEFATVFYATLDRQTMRMTYCSAGHDPALLLRGGEVVELNADGMALGVNDGEEYEKGLIDLQPGDRLLLCSDGVPDASTFSGEKFGKQRIYQAMEDTADGSARDMVNHVLWEVRRFVGLNHRPDDMTLLAVRICEPDGEPESASI